MAAELVHVDLVATPVEKNPISELQEVFQQWKLPMPQYREAHGTFSQFGTEVTVAIHSETMTFHSTGRTKKISKANAANAALDYIKTHEREMLEPPPSMAAVRQKATSVEVKGHDLMIIFFYSGRCGGWGRELYLQERYSTGGPGLVC